MKPKALLTLALALGGIAAVAPTAQAQGRADPPPFRGNAAVGVGASIAVEEVVPRNLFLPGQEPGEGSVNRVHAAKFVCGQVPADGEHSEKPDGEFAQSAHALTPGTYLTAINVLNPGGLEHNFIKFAIEAVPERDFEPGSGARGFGRRVDETLEPFDALEIDCIDIHQDLLGRELGADNPVDFGLEKGFVVIITPDCPIDAEGNCVSDLVVTAVYTYKNVEQSEGEDD